MPDTQRVFAIATPNEGVTFDDMAPVLPYEAARTWELYRDGVAREVWLRTDGLGATAVLESTPAQARRLTDEFPMARAGIVTFECIPVAPFTSLEALFGTQAGETAPAEPPRPEGDARAQKVLAVLRPSATFDPAQLQALVAEETQAVWALWKAGVVREPYLRDDGPGAVLVMEAADSAQAQAILAELPFVKAGALSAECMTVAVFSGWEALLQGGIPAEAAR